jgi:hypothetical protein
MFWGPRWIAYLARGNKASTLQPSQADQNAVFYPAWHGRPAFFDIPSVWTNPRRVSLRGLAILQSYGVPTRLG